MSHGVPRVSGAAGASDKSQQARDKERKQIEQYLHLEKEVRERITAKDYSNTTLQLTSNLLSQNPEYYTIWNDRRRILRHVFTCELAGKDQVASPQDEAAAKAAGLTLPQHEVRLLIQEDLQFLIPLLRQFPKCYWIWNHRAWLLRAATTHLPAANTVELWRGELVLIGKMLALDSRNFHGWGYRRQVVGEIERLSGSSMAEAEFAYTTRMVNTNLSNFSAWHYRSQLIPPLLVERGASSDQRKRMLDEEFELITRALYTDPYDQSLWFYHQYLLSTLDPSNLPSASILEPCSDTERLAYLRQEIANVKDMLDGAEDCKYIYQSLLDSASRYLHMDPSSKEMTTGEMRTWLDALRKLDRLREGRWSDMDRTLGLS